MIELKRCPSCRSILVKQVMNFGGHITMGCNMCGYIWSAHLIANLEAENARLRKENDILRASPSMSVLRRLDIQLKENDESDG